MLLTLKQYLNNKLVKLENEIISASQRLKKEKIISLASLYEQAIQEKRTDILDKMRTTLEKDEILTSDICNYLQKWKIKKNINISNTWIKVNLPDKFKHVEMKRDLATQLAQNFTNFTEAKQKAHDMTKGLTKAEKAIVFETVKDDAQDYLRGNKPRLDLPTISKKVFYDFKGWKCKLSRELAEICKRLEEEHQLENHENIDEDEYAKLIRSEGDNRRIGGKRTMEAILVKVAASCSLADGIKSEQYLIDRKQLDEYESNCDECKKDPEGCKRNYKHCICHAMQKLPTTKGFKFDRDNDADLKKYSQWLDEVHHNAMPDLCVYGKKIMLNERTPKGDRQLTLNRHVDKHNCSICENFLVATPEFFADGS